MRTNLDFRFRAALPEPLLVILWIAAAAAIAAVDYLTGAFSVFFLYALLVVAVSLFLGVWNGVAAASVCSMALFAVNRQSAGGALSGADYFNALGNMAVFLMLVAMAAELKILISRNQALSREDPLTGVLNLHSFRTLLDLETARFRRRKKPFSVAYIDLDNFRSVNSASGHSSGDDALREAADVMKKTVRFLDGVGRVGGDEFAVLLPETGAPEALVAVERLRKACLSAFARKKRKVTFSAGLATFHRSPRNTDEIFRKADNLMVRAKKSGKGRVVRESY